MRGVVVEQEGKLRVELESLEAGDLASAKRIIMLACGTSWHAALAGKYLVEQIARIPVEVALASEYRYREPIVAEGDLALAISQSGETADTLAALREAMLICDPDEIGQRACAKLVMENFVPRAWRRPVTAEEIDHIMGLYDIVVEPTADQTLDREQRVVGVGDRLAFGRLTHQYLVVFAERHDRRSRAIALAVFYDLGGVTFHHCDAGVGGTQVDTNYFAHVIAPKSLKLVQIWLLRGGRGPRFQASSGSLATITLAGLSSRPFSV